jgi:hypothetical protein
MNSSLFYKLSNSIPSGLSKSCEEVVLLVTTAAALF